MPINEIASADQKDPLTSVMEVCASTNWGDNFVIILADEHNLFFEETVNRIQDHHDHVVFFEHNEANTLVTIEHSIKNNPLLANKRITLVNNDMNGWRQIRKTGLDIGFGFYPGFFIKTRNLISSTIFPSPDQVSRDFLNITYNVRWAKTLALMALDSENLLDHGHVSMSDRKFSPDLTPWEEYPTTQQDTMLIPDCHWGRDYSKSVKSWIVHQADLLQKKLPLTLDIDFRNRNDWKFKDVGHRTLDVYLQDSWFDVVVEDAVPQFFMDDDVVIFTEKTVKSIARGRPFLLYGKPGQLDALRQLGFRTFSPWFDESYDDVNHHIHRAQHLARCVKKICELSLSDKMKIWSELQEITAHNLNHLLSMKNKIYWKPIKEFKWK